MFNLWEYLAKQQAIKRCSERDAPQYLKEYVFSNRNFTYHTPVEATRFVVFDTETTGLNPQKDKIISIGAICIEHYDIEIAHSFEAYLKQESSGNKESIPIHQILKQDLQKNATEETEALKDFLTFIGNSVLVAHYAIFDKSILSKALKKCFHIPLLNKAIDTIHLAKRLDGVSYFDQSDSSSYALDQLCEKYQIEVNERHNSAADALATAELFQILLKKAAKKGIRKIGDLLG